MCCSSILVLISKFLWRLISVSLASSCPSFRSGTNKIFDWVIYQSAHSQGFDLAGGLLNNCLLWMAVYKLYPVLFALSFRWDDLDSMQVDCEYVRLTIGLLKHTHFFKLHQLPWLLGPGIYWLTPISKLNTHGEVGTMFNQPIIEQDQPTSGWNRTASHGSTVWESKTLATEPPCAPVCHYWIFFSCRF